MDIVTYDPSDSSTVKSPSQNISLGCQRDLSSLSSIRSSFKHSSYLTLHFCESVIMAFSSGMKCTANRVGLTPVMVMVLLLLLLGTVSCRFDVAAAPYLKIANEFQEGKSITVLSLPGCCNGPCKPNDDHVVCSWFCARCPDMVVEGGQVGMVDQHVGPYPLPYLMIRVEPDVVFCVEGKDLRTIKSWDTVAVGPHKCGPWSKGLGGHVSAPHGTTGYPICLYLCERDK